MNNKVNILHRIFFTKNKFIQHGFASFYGSPFVENVRDVKIKYEVTEDFKDWEYVERILPPLVVPTPSIKASYSSEWKPQTENVKNMPYFISRSKNHMIPVYLKTSQRGMKRITKVKNIQGDIWLLEKELKNFLQEQQVKPIRSQVDEFSRYIRFHGDYVNAIKYWLSQKDL